MHIDVNQLKDFYYQSALGQVAKSTLRAKVLQLWPLDTCKGQTLVGFGFSNPVMRPFLPYVRRAVNLMPSPQGAMVWPSDDSNMSVLAEETSWPVETGCVDRLIVMHGFDTSDYSAAVLEECYRVLGPGGRALFIVPSRTGLWARSERTPFFYSRPFSAGQLEARLLRHGLKRELCISALYQPPWSGRFWLKIGASIEQIGQSVLSRHGGGVLIMEAVKQIPRPRRPGVGVVASSPFGVLKGVRTPKPTLGRGAAQ